MEMVKEVRRQFKEIPGIMEGTGTPDYSKCVEISTRAALREMMLPGALTIITPLLIGLGTGLISGNWPLAAEVLGGYMAGVAVSGVLWAIFQNNAGGAWDNAKKSFEAGVEIDGEMTFKGSDAHKAAVTGDTVGDPFKDTSGPSMNILIKLTCLVGLVIAPIMGDGHGGNDGSTGATCKAKTECHKDSCGDKKSCHGKKHCKKSCDGENKCSKGDHMIGKCDIRECAKMNAAECEAMCDSLGCTLEEKEACLAHYDAEGNFIMKDHHDKEQ